MIDTLSQKLAELRTRREREDGFTLIELLVVVVIIGILIAIAIPLYLNYQKGAHDKSAQSDLRAAVSAYEQCYTENSPQAYPTDAAGTDHNASYTLTCGSATESVKLSDGTHLLYTSADGTSYTLVAWNTGGHTAAGNPGYKTFSYDSSAGGSIN